MDFQMIAPRTCTTKGVRYLEADETFIGKLVKAERRPVLRSHIVGSGTGEEYRVYYAFTLLGSRIETAPEGEPTTVPDYVRVLYCTMRRGSVNPLVVAQVKDVLHLSGILLDEATIEDEALQALVHLDFEITCTHHPTKTRPDLMYATYSWRRYNETAASRLF